MAIGRTNAGGGGGGGLNFKVVGGTTQPTSPKENTIWVNTDVAIPSWAFSATEPESPVAGMVWILTGNSSIAPFNALKKMELDVYPIGARQYVGGAWARNYAWLYKGGTWVQFSSEEYKIFEDGEFYNDIEFVGTNKIVNDWDYSSSATAPTIAVTEGNMHIHLAQKSGASGAAITKNKIDITRLKTIKCDINDAHTTGLNVNRTIAIGLYANNNLQLYTNAAALTTKQTPITNKSWAVDVSELSGEYYLAVYMQGYNNAVDVTISLIVGLEV